MSTSRDPHLRSRNVPSSLTTAIDMDEFDVNVSSNSSRAPLLSSPTSSHSDTDDRRYSYGSGSGSGSSKSDTVINVTPRYDDEDPSVASQAGVQQADAINLVWTRDVLVTVYLFIFLCSFAKALQWQVMVNLMPFVVSEFNSHSLIPTIGIVASILSGVLNLPVAKIIDSWGRPQGLASMVVLSTVGLLLMAACQDVKSYAAAQVIYQVGISGFSYILDIIIADTSSLKNRVLAFAFNNSPYLITTFLGPPIAKVFYEKSSWRLAFAIFAVVLFLLSLPVLSILFSNTRKAQRLGVLKKSPSTGPWTTSKLRKYLTDFDALGLALISGGMTLILVPFSLTSVGTEAGSLGSHTVTLILGLLLMVLFAFHERKTERPFIKFSLLCSRNVAGACLLSITIFIAYMSWDGYYTSYLQVVHDLTITEAGYVGQIYSIGSSIWAVVVGYLIRRTDRFKWLAVAALPVHILGGALMIIFRRPDTHLVWVIMCQILITIGGSTLVVCEQMAVMAVADHTELASVMALLTLATYIGSAIGSSFSGAIWNSTLPTALAELLPQVSPAELNHIASDLTKQLSYPVGDPIREAIVAAYGKSQLRMCIAGTLISLVEIVAVLVWKDCRVSQSRQVKGTVI
ncbi:MFS general substrate transporter [Xylariaceae sp. FL0016]|nr:MFS general substrate transporter [Xylariaceae sp. FL0016]